MPDIRTFSLIVVDDSDTILDKMDLPYVDSPNNLGFEIEFSSLESGLTTYFSDPKEKRQDISFNLVFPPPDPYAQSKQFKEFVQKYINSNLALEYNDTKGAKRIEGRIRKFGLSEITDWGGLLCPMVFSPSTPKYTPKSYQTSAVYSTEGKSYPESYPYSYGKSLVTGDSIDNTYFDDIPLVVTIHGPVDNPYISLQDIVSGEIYSTVRFLNFYLGENDYVTIDAVRSKITAYRNSEHFSAYDFVSKESTLDSFLYAKGQTKSKIIISSDSTESVEVSVRYHQYTM